MYILKFITTTTKKFNLKAETKFFDALKSIDLQQPVKKFNFVTPTLQPGHALYVSIYILRYLHKPVK